MPFEKQCPSIEHISPLHKLNFMNTIVMMQEGKKSILDMYNILTISSQVFINIHNITTQIEEIL